MELGETHCARCSDLQNMPGVSVKTFYEMLRMFKDMENKNNSSFKISFRYKSTLLNALLPIVTQYFCDKSSALQR